MSERITIVGSGYVGLVSGVCLAAMGHEVTCVDLEQDRVDAINAGDAPIHEEGLPALLADVIGARLHATTDLAQAVADTDVTILAVGTPFGENRIDLQQIETAARDVGAALRAVDDYHVVVVKSTVVPGTTADLVKPALEAASGKRVGPDLGLAMNPEFLREGVAVQDFLEPDRIVIGGVDERSTAALRRIYEVFEGTPIVEVDPTTAEMIKYAANGLLATLISFSNEIANLSARVGTDVVDVLSGVHLDRRISPVVDGQRVTPGLTAFLAAGCGFGGSCFPKDVKALVAHGESAGVPMGLLRAVLEINHGQAEVLVERVAAAVALSGATIALLGAAFKPGTDDVRESPTLRIAPRLLEAGARVIVHDPVATANCRQALDGHAVTYTDDLQEALAGADAIVIITAWDEYRQIPELLAGRPVPVIDGRRLLDASDVTSYDGIGYPHR